MTLKYLTLTNSMQLYNSGTYIVHQCKRYRATLWITEQHCAPPLFSESWGHPEYFFKILVIDKNIQIADTYTTNPHERFQLVLSQSRGGSELKVEDGTWTRP